MAVIWETRGFELVRFSSLVGYFISPERLINICIMIKFELMMKDCRPDCL